MNIPALFPPSPITGWTEKEDAGRYKPGVKSNAIEKETEDGYVFSRPRSTRKPPQTFKTGFTAVDQNHVDILMAMWEQYDKYRSFTYSNWVNGKTYTVRFLKEPEYTYVGMGQTRLYNVDIELITS